MGAMITIIYDEKIVLKSEVETMSRDIQAMTSQIMGAKDVFVYTNKVELAFAIDPIEVFIQVNEAKTPSPAKLINEIAEGLAIWKSENKFSYPINLNVIPVVWHAKFGI